MKTTPLLLALALGLVQACNPTPKVGTTAIQETPTPTVTPTPVSTPYIESRPVVDPAANIEKKALVVPPPTEPPAKL